MGSSSHLCGMLLMNALGTQLTTIPYKGTGPAMTDILGKRIDLMCDQTTNTTNNIEARSVKAYAVTTPSRLKNLPDLPTASEAGLNGFEISAWHGLYAPKNTPPAVVERLSSALWKALKDENLIRRFAMLGTAPVSDVSATPKALKAKLESEVKRWEPIIKAAGTFAD
jgi:tripartite-type tricarboxylate transporter receptor subunit TctC